MGAPWSSACLERKKGRKDLGILSPHTTYRVRLDTPQPTIPRQRKQHPAAMTSYHEFHVDRAVRGLRWPRHGRRTRNRRSLVDLAPPSSLGGRSRKAPATAPQRKEEKQRPAWGV